MSRFRPALPHLAMRYRWIALLGLNIVLFAAIWWMSFELRFDFEIPVGRRGYDHGSRLRMANERTVRWLERCNAAHLAGGRAAEQALFGIVQGGRHEDLRRASARLLDHLFATFRGRPVVQRTNQDQSRNPRAPGRVGRGRRTQAPRRACQP